MGSSKALRILYVGRKPKLADTLRTLFDQHNDELGQTSHYLRTPIHFCIVSNQKLALHRIRSEPPRVVIVEIEKKSESRVRFCEMVRYRLPTAAILALAALKPEQSFAFDGFIRAPVIPTQLFATLEQLPSHCSDYLLQRGSLTLNIATRTVTTAKGDYTMTPKQCALLQLLMTHHNEVVKRGDIMQMIWETSYLDDTRTLDVHIRWLRERIEPDPSNPVYLKTVRGIGYRLNIQEMVNAEWTA
jgi:DNA-binding response OmpR family regulator